jgi:amino acid permease
MFSSSFSLLAFMGVSAGSGKVFNWFANMTAVAGLLTWFGISFTYTRFYAGMKAQGIDRKTLPFASPLQPFAAWYALVCCLVISLVRLSVVIHLELTIDQKNPIALHSSAAGLSSSAGTGTRPPLSQITCPL